MIRINCRFFLDWQPYAYSETRASLTTDQEITKLLTRVNLKKMLPQEAGVPLHVEGDMAYLNAETENMVIFGETGSKKTRCVIRPLIAMAASAGESLVITDVKGELATDARLQEYLKHCGYRFVYLDFRSFASDGYNILKYPFHLYCGGKKDKAMACVTSIVSLLSAVYKDTSADPFWEYMSNQHLISVIHLLFEVCSQKRSYHKYVNMLTLSTYTNESATTCLEQLVDNFLQESSSGSVHMLRSILSAPEKTRASITATTASLLKDFVVQQSLLEMLSTSTFDPIEMYRKPTALFLILPDETNAYDHLGGLMIDQIYSQLIEEYTNTWQNRTDPPCRINMVCDEVCNLQINDLMTKISISHSRQIRWYLVCQSKAQLEQAFPRDASTILGNCKDMLFLQSSDSSLLQYVSEVSGKSSIGEDGQHAYRLQPEHLRTLRKTREYKEAIYIRDDICYLAVLPDIDQYAFLQEYPCGFFSIPGCKRESVQIYTPQKMMRDIINGRVAVPFSSLRNGEESL